ncbi:DUF2624 domain-containing protein [Virgibacillus ihumii]|uniref:DUF2624 domain-containing protein n=1 Tax=Virgibacillus ihumii TaxID=2686091 RepID=UPI00157D7F0D|nr:DUF2624 domain-containing protein [Virgibacillus ihumii]
MTNFIKELIMNKLKQLSAKELLHYSKQYGFSISYNQAKQIESYLKQNKVDPFSETGRKKLYKDLTQITDQSTAQKAQRLFEKMIQEHGLEYLF